MLGHDSVTNTDMETASHTSGVEAAVYSSLSNSKLFRSLIGHGGHGGKSVLEKTVLGNSKTAEISTVNYYGQPM
jgi:hypothetical protein